MRKLLVLMLVLVMASLASATTVDVTGDTLCAVGATRTYTITLNGTTPGLGLISFDLDAHGSNAKATMSNWTIVSTGRNTALDYIGDPLHTPPDYGKEIGGTQDAGTTPIGTTMLTFDLTGVTAGTIDLTTEDYAFIAVLSGGGWEVFHPTMGSLQVTIPEPMTLVLLGLGGLFLRRRK